MKLFYTDTFEIPLPDSHRFPMSKYRLLRENLKRRSAAEKVSFVMSIPPAATDEQLGLVHDESYLRDVVDGTLTAEMVKRIGFPWSPELVERSRRSTGATIAAAGAALGGGCAANLAGGTHHAYADKGEGFCLFNDVCVAAKCLQLDRDLQRILVIDCDVHQGNGTAKIMAGEDSMFSFSIHSEKNYPFQKEKSDLDIGLDRRTGDDEYLRALDTAIKEIDQRFDPEFVFYIAGADPFVDDRLGRLALTKDGLAARDRLVIGTYRHRQLPVAIAMGGGYAKQIDDIVDIHSNTILIASEFCNETNV